MNQLADREAAERSQGDGSHRARIPEIIAGLKGWCRPFKARWLYDAVLARARAGDFTGVEIGVFGGRSLIAAALALKDAGRGFLVGIDPYTAESATEGAANGQPWVAALPCIRQECEAAITRLGLGRHCAVLPAPAEACAAAFGPLDYLHVDGCHATAVALRDVTLYVPKVRPGGLIVLDDTNWDTLQPALRRVRRWARRVYAAPTWGAYVRR